MVISVRNKRTRDSLQGDEWAGRELCEDIIQVILCPMAELQDAGAPAQPSHGPTWSLGKGPQLLGCSNTNRVQVQGRHLPSAPPAATSLEMLIQFSLCRLVFCYLTHSPNLDTLQVPKEQPLTSRAVTVLSWTLESEVANGSSHTVETFSRSPRLTKALIMKADFILYFTISSSEERDLPQKACGTITVT